MQTIEGVEYDVILTVDAPGASYDWAAASLLRDPQGRLYLVSDSGCSCDSHMSYVSRSDLTPVATWQQAAAHFGEGERYSRSVRRSDFRAAARAAVQAGDL